MMDLQPDPWFVVTVALDTNYDNLSSLSIISAPQFKRSNSGRSTVGGTLERSIEYSYDDDGVQISDRETIGRRR
jgi:hypothetical protein